MSEKEYIKQLEEENATLRSRLEDAAQWIPQWVYPYDMVPPKHAEDLLEYRKEYFMKSSGTVLDPSNGIMMNCSLPVAEYRIKKFVIGSITAETYQFRWDRVDRRGANEITVRFKHAKDKIESYWRYVTDGH